jgi:hypothetical protein
MFCPACKAEYRPGFTRCADCDVDLVDTLPSVDKDTLPDESTREVWAGDNQDECVTICELLKVKEIPFTVQQRKRQFLQSADKAFTIRVPEDFHSRAKNITGDFSDEPEQQQDPVEFPEAGDSFDNATQIDARRAFTAPWYPEDAIVEVWSSPTDNYESLIVASLKESLIRCRQEVSEDGVHHAFVLPDDEELAKEIVREIEHGSPE